MRKLAVVLSFFCLVTFAQADSTPHWFEVRSDHFIVLTDTSEKQARQTAGQFERMRSLFHTVLPNAASDAASPIVVLALRDKKDFSTLEPTAYLAKNALDLAGLFLRTPDQNYILLRLNSEGDHPYATVYHEYTHFITRKAEWLPLWLSEGLAEFYQNTTIEEKDALVGQPSADDIYYLRDNRLLPLTTLFAVDHNSPYYHDEQKGSVFYAESWALTHMLEISDSTNKTNKVGDYAKLLINHVDSVTAAQQAFGDLGKLQKQLESYISQGSFRLFKINMAFTVDEASFKSIPVTQADANAIRADVLVWNDRRPEAKSLLEATLNDDPENAAAHESMGSLCYAEHDSACAKKWYGEAIQLDAASYMAHYFYAVMLLQDGDPSHDAEIESNLRTAIKLEPAFAGSYDALGRFYAMHQKNLEEARILILKAIQLEPEEIAFRLNYANILMELKLYDDAIRSLNTALKISKTSSDTPLVQERINQIKEFQASMKRVEAAGTEAPRLDDDGPQLSLIARKDSAATTNSDSGPTEERTFPAPAANAPHHSALGTLRNVKCSYPAVMTLDVESKGKTVSLFASNYYKISFSTLGFAPTGELKPCTGIEGMKAKVDYAEVSDKTVSGQILTIQLTK